VISGYAAHISLGELGFGVQAFVHLQLAQGRLDEVVGHLAALPEVIQSHSTTGDGDLLCFVATRDNQHLEQVVQTLLATPGVVRTRTEVALRERVPYRVLPLLHVPSAVERQMR
jgi:DNA-binding Lrp family transcriptional regulator